MTTARGNVLEGIRSFRREQELYNLADDPYELENLYAAPSQSDRVRALSENLAKLKNAAGAELRAAGGGGVGRLFTELPGRRSLARFPRSPCGDAK